MQGEVKQERPFSDRHLFEPEMVLVPAGPFRMGGNPQEDPSVQARERPQHRLHLPAFNMARTPVTNAQFAPFVDATGHRPPDHWSDGGPPQNKTDHPIVHVSWYDALAYCRWLAGVTGRPYRLPSEAEWEKAASWDPEAKRRYPWGDTFDAERCNTKEGGPGDTTPVDAYPGGASPYGLLDMAGNVYEWTLSLWGKDMQEPAFVYPYEPSDGRENLEAGNGVLRVLRGGAFFYDALYARTTHRLRSYPDYRVRTRGFRVCMDG